MNVGKKIKTLLLLIGDITAIWIAYTFSFFVKYSEIKHGVYVDFYEKHLFFIIIIYLISLFICRMYNSVWDVAGFEEFLQAGTAIFIGTCLNIFYVSLVATQIPITLIILSGILIFMLSIGERLFYKIVRRMMIYKNILSNKTTKKVLIIGAGSCARAVIRDIQKDINNNLRAVAVIDDDVKKHKTFVNGVKVYGGRAKILKIVKEKKIDLILIAIGTLDSKNKGELITICNKTKKIVKIIPSVNELIEGEQSGINSMRDIDLHDLLGREEIKLEKKGIKEYIENKIVLVTGGGGSIGSELCRQIAKYSPKTLIILDIYENNAYEIQNELKMKHPKLKEVTIIASVREYWRMNQIFEQYMPQVVFHAAAHKHVPLMEVSPLEAIKNNIRGTYNTADLAYKYAVEKFVLISTDKAVNPTNVMGATKRYCEMIIQGMQKKANDNMVKTEFVAVRFGNVLGSNGSVIPLFKKQIKEGGPITLTHKNMTRYFMLIPEAVQLVLQAGGGAKGGEIFVLDMGNPVKIYDLAKNLIKLSGFEPHVDIKIQEIGLRDGEKLYEELLMEEEGLKETNHKKIFIAKPSEYDIEELEKNIYELIKIGQQQGDEALKEKLSQYVPTYVRKSEELIAISEEDAEEGGLEEI